ncbi:hypothetical protein AAFF_G00359130 [Aldrovandia affinis]|uniref:Uncharacterized protein n=1 Tax=Aldrovandia affinis TaxID=143900 RepID=A0AAD7SJ03_9TELE|nr:hypothetical protein AAFF_G00359130 [Aldrovandia affinis]
MNLIDRLPRVILGGEFFPEPSSRFRGTSGSRSTDTQPRRLGHLRLNSLRRALALQGRLLIQRSRPDRSMVPSAVGDGGSSPGDDHPRERGGPHPRARA